MPNKTLQVRVSDKSYHLFKELYENKRVKNLDLTKKDLMDENIKKAYIHEFNLDEKEIDINKVLDNQQYLLKKIYEYVTLLVKANSYLPINVKDINKYVYNTSRFEKLIVVKIKNQNESLCVL